MKVATVLLTAVLVVGLVSTASAVNKVWWEAVPKTADSFVTQQGEGLGLELQCGVDALPTRCEWNITMYLRNDQGISGWANDLATTPDDDTLFVKDFEYLSWFAQKTSGFYYPFSYVNYNATAGSGDALLTGAAGFLLGTVGPPPASYYPNGFPLIRFTLSKSKEPGAEGGWTDVHTTVGAWEWGSDTGTTMVQFGDNAPISGVDGTLAPNAVIRVNNVPEPATLALLGLGALCLIRRRR